MRYLKTFLLLITLSLTFTTHANAYDDKGYKGKAHSKIKQNRVHFKTEENKQAQSEVDKFNQLLKKKPTASGKPKKKNTYSGHKHSHRNKFKQ